MRITRRRALQLGGGALLYAGCGVDLGLNDDASFDEVLEALHGTAPEFGNGLSNHGPMAAEALVALGEDARVVPFIDAYAARLRLEPQPEVDDEDPAAQLAREWSRLVPGWIAAGWHGPLRVCHALRSISREDTPVRRRELAYGLRYWSHAYAELPGAPGSAPEAGLDVVTALERVRVLPEDEQIRSGLIAPRFAPLEGDADFLALVAAADLEALDVSEAIHGLAAAAARALTRNGNSAIALLHAVTGTSCLRLALPFLDEAQQRAALGYAFQAVAGVLACQGSAPVDVLLAPVDDDVDPSALREAARTSSDEHVVKLVEAALREHEIEPKPEFLIAAANIAGLS